MIILSFNTAMYITFQWTNFRHFLIYTIVIGDAYGCVWIVRKREVMVLKAIRIRRMSVRMTFFIYL